jgi:hypothetical protein
MLTAFILIGMGALGGAVAQGHAQDQTESQAQGRTSAQTHALTDVGVGFYKTFTTATSGQGTVQTPSNSAGGMLEVRHIVSSLLGYEFTFSFNPYNQMFTPKVGDCGYICQNQPTKISGKGSTVAVDWVVSHKMGKFRPFAVAGMGFFITSGGSSVYGSNTIVRPGYIFGGGTDWEMNSRIGFRFQFRDNVSKAPNISMIYHATGAYTNTAEPMAGVYYRF